MQTDNTMIHCNKCGYRGKGRGTSAIPFLAMMGTLMASAFFLPLIVVSLGMLVWMVSQPAKRSCPVCKSLDVSAPAESQT